MAAKAHARWEGDLDSGSGSMETGTGLSATFTKGTRFADEEGSNPEELIGAALAGCFSMARSNILAGEDLSPRSVETNATVSMQVGDDGPRISRIALDTTIDADGDDDTLRSHAEAAKNGCPVSKALTGVDEIVLDVTIA
ncbi:OsmC family peroxiredoxin [Salsipaludibacter albus]|uniref:OsmC family peroxiredoxin n=1 Tax=Salsipaludibacter albus TaxID=2849650 RepID=UPI001EE4C46E|nr:OsmC family peroxiredoxin [Salsipaludibacter albus]MBY5162511.1 OsmC family peroxiredoxin [Salsipaludibacter albus]